MKVKVFNSWVEQIKSGNWPYFSHINFFTIGRTDDQYFIIIFNFSIIFDLL